MRIALRSSCVHLEAYVCQGKVRPHTSCCLVAHIPVSSPVHNHYTYTIYLHLGHDVAKYAMKHENQEETTSRTEMDMLGMRRHRWDRCAIQSLGDEEHVIPVQASGRRKLQRENPVRMVAHL